ncbi:hypothetical protein BC829DRAFT_433987 [Chytridium lagenaria]|nr:hypothetical protein BC829DRAFT_433987 [Chytridium lagenaria]
MTTVYQRAILSIKTEEEAAKAAKGEGKRETLALKCPPKMVKVHLPNPGYGREQIPRLSRFICVLFVHVWSSNSLAETLECKMNPFLVVYVQNILEITRMPLPVITLAIKYTQRLRRLLMIQAESESASSRSRHPSQLRRLTPMEGPTWPSSRLFANATPSRTSFTSFSMTNEEARVLSVALILAQKYSDDAPYGNRVWGQILGLGAGMLSSLEARFLALIGFNLYRGAGVGERVESIFGGCGGYGGCFKFWREGRGCCWRVAVTGFGNVWFEWCSGRCESGGDDGGVECRDVWRDG